MNETIIVPKWLLASLLVLSVLLILFPYAGTFAWSAILAIVVYPIFIRTPIANHKLRSLIFTLTYAIIVIVPLTTLCILGINEFINYINHNASFPDIIANIHQSVQSIPYVGKIISSKITIENIKHYTQEISFNQLKVSASSFMTLQSNVFHYLLAFLISLLSFYNFLSHAEAIKKWLCQTLLSRLKKPSYIVNLALTSTRGSVVPLLINAFLAATLMTCVYYFLGLSVPIFLGIITFICAIIPFLVIVLYLTLFIILLLIHNTAAAIILIGCGVTLNLILDNVVQPKILAKTVNMPFIISFLGVILGLESFGVLGIFFGPTILYVAQKIALTTAEG